MARNKSGLGKGLDLLIPQEIEAQADSKDAVKLKISKVEPNRNQPRKNFDEGALEELANSIKQYGVLQPIIVCKKDDYYQIIAGERRWRAAMKAGLSEVPVIIKEYTDREIMEISLIENIQRENLNAIEEALGYKQLIDEYGLTQETLAEKISKSRTAVTNAMRLLKLDEAVQQMVIDGSLSGGHARALLGLSSAKKQLEAAKKIVDEKLSVRQTEELVKAMNKPASAKAKPAVKNAYIYKDLEKQMTEAVGTRVKIKQGAQEGTGKVEITYCSEDDLDKIYRLLRR